MRTKDEQIVAAYKRVDKVTKGTIDAFCVGYQSAVSDIKTLSDEALLSILAGRYRTFAEVEQDLSYSDARRGPNDKEQQEAHTRKQIDNFIEHHLQTINDKK